MELFYVLAPSDYTSTTRLVTFAPGSRLQSFTVPIVDDANVEPPVEYFTAVASLTTPNVVVSISRPMATVAIEDDDSKWHFLRTSIAFINTA